MYVGRSGIRFHVFDVDGTIRFVDDEMGERVRIGGVGDAIFILEEFCKELA